MASSAKRARLESNEEISASSGVVKAHLFNVIPVSRFDLKFPSFLQPVEVGGFSLDRNRSFINDRSQLRTYKLPIENVPIAWDLKSGYDTFLRRDDSEEEHLDYLLEWIRANRRLVCGNVVGSTSTSEGRLNSDFVCWRGLLTKVLCTPYENRDGWRLAVSLYDKTLYLCEFDCDKTSFDDGYKNSDLQKEFTYWGFKFETYVTAASADSFPDTEQPVNNKQAFVSVVKTRLSSHSMIFGGEVDCCETNDANKYIELKTNRQLDKHGQIRNFRRYKLLKWWAQSFLIGISKIVCGFRDDAGTVRELKEFSTVEIPKLCEKDGWSANVCFNFLDQFLQFIKDSVTLECDRAIYVFSWSPGESSVRLQVEDPLSSKFTFLPAWYTVKPAFGRPEQPVASETVS